MCVTVCVPSNLHTEFDRCTCISPCSYLSKYLHVNSVVSYCLFDLNLHPEVLHPHFRNVLSSCDNKLCKLQCVHTVSSCIELKAIGIYTNLSAR